MARKPKHVPPEIQANMPQQVGAEEQMPQMAQPKSELQARAEQEMQMLQRTAEYKQMQAQMPPKIGVEQIRKANETLQKYKAGKANLEKKIIANEQFWKLRQWEYEDKNDSSNINPATAWLWSCIQSRYSDAMDSYPTCNFQPRQMDDKAEAQKLSSIVPIILEHNRYEDVYSDIVWYTLKHGGCVQGIFWDGSKHNGLGDVVVKKIDLLNFFWESGIADIQESRNIFTTELVANELLEQRYPQCVGKLGGEKVTIAKYLFDDHVDTSDKSVCIDWYYKKWINGKQTVQYVKYVNDIVLYATENDTKVPEKVTVDPQTGIPLTIPLGKSMAERGFYDHSLYPFVTMALYPVEGSICGYGLTDIGRDTQLQIDKLNKAVIENALAGATPRYFTRGDGTINEAEYADFTKKFIKVEGQIGDEGIRPIDHKDLDSVYVNFLMQKIDEMKYITSNQDVGNGVAPNGITAGSAISALQESQGKNARSSNKTFHRAFREVCYQIVELIRQFYDVPRTFRINPDGMRNEQYISYSNAGIKPQQMQTMGINMGIRVPEFDIDVTSEKANPYKKMEINELALNFYNLGFFNPEMTDQALACLNMMDFTKKEDVMAKIRENGTMQEMLIRYQQLALTLASQISPEVAEQVAQMVLQQSGQPVPQAIGAVGAVNLDGSAEEHPFNQKAREQARASTQAD